MMLSKTHDAKAIIAEILFQSLFSWMMLSKEDTVYIRELFYGFNPYSRG